MGATDNVAGDGNARFIATGRALGIILVEGWILPGPVAPMGRSYNVNP